MSEKALEVRASKDFILLVYLPLDYGTEDAKEVRPDWDRLLERWKTEGIYVTSFVYPVKGYLISGQEKVISEGSLVSDSLRLISSLIIKAPDYEEAVALASNCPVLAQGGTVEVREVQPRPVEAEKVAMPGQYRD